MNPTERRNLVATLTTAVDLIERMATPGAHHAEMTVRSLRWHIAKLRESEQSTQVYRRTE